MNHSAFQQLLTLIFMLFAIVAILVFFAIDDHKWFYILSITAIVIRVLQYIMRFIERRNRKAKKVDLDF